MTAIIPRHEQHWPTKLLSHRLQEYVLDNGQPPTQNRALAKRITGQQVLDAVMLAQSRLGPSYSNIDARYYIGTCFHEAGCTNEWDTEIATQSSPEGFVSVGAYQIGKEEAARFGFMLEDMLDLDKSSTCMIRLAEYNRAAIRRVAGLSPTAPDPDYTDPDGIIWKGGAMRAYLAITHNHGVGFMRATVARYGLDWGAYKQRNPKDNIVAHKYGEDCVTGGPNWPRASFLARPMDVGAHRTLMLTQPHMKGTDVQELQRHLLMLDPKLIADGDFGARTDHAVRMFQRDQGLTEDGKVGPKTWALLLSSPI